MKTPILKIALTLTLTAGAALAAGPLRTTDGDNPMPLRWDTSALIPAWTDGGGAFTYDFDGVTPFITIDRANEITAFALDQWSSVSTSTFSAQIAGTIEDVTGIADVTGANASQIYTAYNGGGMFVLYDTDGSILEDFFGVPKQAILGIGFPEWSDGNGTILESTSLINGWFVYDYDVNGDLMSGVFTHELGHAINLSHTQVNGHLAYYSYTYAPEYPGVPGCPGVEPWFRYDYPPFVNPRMNPDHVETMYPIVDNSGPAGTSMSTINVTDDMVAISNLYPTPDYATSRGSIRGVLTLKDGTTQYSGINIVARNVNDMFEDAVSAMSGDQTQGKIGPDGRFTINGLTPGESYVVYVEQIVTGGFPTSPTVLPSEAEYWNVGEGSDPASDDACDATSILAEAGVVKTADIVFNGYDKGVDFLPIPASDILDAAKSGRAAIGTTGPVVFIWDELDGIGVVPGARGNAYINRNGSRVGSHLMDGNGWLHGAIFDVSGGVSVIQPLPEAGTCTGSSSQGPVKSSVWDMDDSGKVLVGLTYVDYDGNGSCPQRKGEIVPFSWTARDGMQILDTSGIAGIPSFVRAQSISGNGKVILGSNGGSRGLAWIDGQMFDLYAMAGIREAYTVNYDGTKAVLATSAGAMKMWDYRQGAEGFTDLGSVRWCDDVPFFHFRFGALCDQGYTHEDLAPLFGPPPMFPLGISDNGEVITGRAGSFFTGIVPTLYTPATGWINLTRFMEQQGVVEASNFDLFNPIVVSASGSEIFGTAGNGYGYRIDLDQVYVCQDGQSVLTGWPHGTALAVGDGAELGRCEFLP